MNITKCDVLVFFYILFEPCQQKQKSVKKRKVVKPTILSEFNFDVRLISLIFSHTQMKNINLY